MKKIISPMQRHFLHKETLHWTESGIISPDQQEAILQLYETAEPKKTNITQILIAIGAILLGLGVLSFVASNWGALNDWTKFSLQLLLFLVLVLGGHAFDGRSPKWAEALFIISAFAYGALIFQIGQIFHLGGSVDGLFIAWSLGILPLAYDRRNRFLIGLTHGLFYLYYFVNMVPLIEPFPHAPATLTTALIYIAQLIGFTLMTTGLPLLRNVPSFVRNGLAGQLPKGQFMLRFINVAFIYFSLYVISHQYAIWLSIIGVLVSALILAQGATRLQQASFTLFAVAVGQLLVAEWISASFIAALLYLLVVGLSLSFAYRMFPSLQPWSHPSMLLTFVTLVLLSFQSSWLYTTGYESVSYVYLLFIALSFVYALALIKLWHPRAIWLVAFVIFRIYVDVSFLFANKALAFVAGGALLLAMAYGISRYTKKGGNNDEQTS